MRERFFYWYLKKTNAIPAPEGKDPSFVPLRIPLTKEWGRAQKVLRFAHLLPRKPFYFSFVTIVSFQRATLQKGKEKSYCLWAIGLR